MCTFSALGFLSRFRHQMGRTKQKDVSGHMRKTKAHIRLRRCSVICAFTDRLQNLCILQNLSKAAIVLCVFGGVEGVGGPSSRGELENLSKSAMVLYVLGGGGRCGGPSSRGEGSANMRMLEDTFSLDSALVRYHKFSYTEVLTKLLISLSLICFCELGSGVFCSNI